jgi:hypothetical protein
LFSLDKIAGYLSFFNKKYSLRFILLFTNTDISIIKICLNTTILAKSNINQRE